MRPIKIESKKIPQIQTALDDVNDKNTKHAITDAREIFEIATVAEDDLLGIVNTKKSAVGAQYFAESSEPVAGRYKYPRNGTRILMKRKTRGWYLIEVKQIQLWPSDGGREGLMLTPGQDKIAIEHIRRRYTILPKEVADDN